MDIEDHNELLSYLVNATDLQVKDVIKIENLKGGVSNKTVQIFFTDGSSWVIKQALEKLRVKGDWFSDPERIFFEAEAMKWLQPHVHIANLIFDDRSNFLLVMEGIPTPFKNLKSLFLENGPKKSLIGKAGIILGTIHHSGQQKIPDLLTSDRFFKSLRVDPYYVEVSRQIPSTNTFINELIDESSQDRFTFTHGDFSPKNLLVKNNELILLDHEVAHFGDGTFDLGFFISHLMSKANHIPTYCTRFIEGILQFYSHYKSNNPLDPVREFRAIRHAVACFLARVRGLSPLEYLTSEEQKKQEKIGLSLIKEIPPTMDQFVLKLKDLLHVRD